MGNRRSGARGATYSSMARGRSKRAERSQAMFDGETMCRVKTANRRLGRPIIDGRDLVAWKDEDEGPCISYVKEPRRMSKTISERIEELFLKSQWYCIYGVNARSVLLVRRSPLQGSTASKNCTMQKVESSNTRKFITNWKYFMLLTSVLSHDLSFDWVRSEGLLAIHIGSAHAISHEILENSLSLVDIALNSGSKLSQRSSLTLLECLSIITFIGGEGFEDTEKSMKIMWKIIQQSSEVFNLSLCVALRDLEKFSSQSRSRNVNKDDDGYSQIQEWKEKILNQIESLLSESTTEINYCNRLLFQDFLEFLKDGYAPESAINIGRDVVSTETWSQLIQLNYLKSFLGSGFVKHAQENDSIRDFLDFAPLSKQPLPAETLPLRSTEKVSMPSVFHPELRKGSKLFQRVFQSPNSVVSKARTRMLNKERRKAQCTNGIPKSPLRFDA
ncbi:hypothetical protein GIB67_027794 [Kingdonia uniflora]|uniref:Interferon-related developmental regulator N-terminal domain-containing protein n=1 Tax=Kingdonia uniflora TaxID=39325 RepID=A0A7J7PD76_9MAGN|nr:hypothetical protein GIB67_027794 [Kingdonia uniflora]